VDITTAAGLTTVTNALVANTLVKVYGTPEVSGHLKASIIVYYAGTLPTA
jgi:hypothetical protein